MFTTTITGDVRFPGRVFSKEHPGRTYPPGTRVDVLSRVVHDGVCLVRFPGGEETYLSISRLDKNPGR